jgi:Domain of unknown function (DUF4345)
MSALVGRASVLLHLGYGLYLVGVGVAGIALPRWELSQVFGLDVENWALPIQATFLNQYRFLKAVELGAGLFCLVLWRPIQQGERVGLVFVALLAAGILARLVAWVSDGQPHPAFIGFMALEIVVLAVYLLHRAQEASRVR